MLLTGSALVAMLGIAASAPPPDDAELAAAATLTPELAARLALARNPRLDEARAALTAAWHEVGRAGGTTDPTLEYMLAPASIGMGWGQSLTLRWSFPWPGTAAARAREAQGMARVEAVGIALVRRDLALEARSLVHELGTFEAARALIAEHLDLLARLRGGLPDLAMAADAAVDEADKQLELVELARMERRLTIALNTLLRRAPDAPLPPAPALVEPPAAPAPLDTLLAAARTARPELAVAQARVEAGALAVAAVEAENRPMLGVGVGVDTMQDDVAMWPRVMVMVELPFEQARRTAAEDAARARVAAARAGVDMAEAEAAGAVARERAELELLREALGRADTIIRLADARLALAGPRGVSDTVTAARALLDLRLRRLDLLREAWLADARLTAAIGGAP